MFTVSGVKFLLEVGTAVKERFDVSNDHGKLVQILADEIVDRTFDSQAAAGLRARDIVRNTLPESFDFDLDIKVLESGDMLVQITDREIANARLRKMN